MTDETNSGAQSERSQLDAVDDLDIAALRRAAKVLSIPSQRDWTKADYVAAIKAKQSRNSGVNLVFDDSQAPKPGYARIKIHRDPTPGHKNSPIHIGLNGQLFQVPRGLEVDLPYTFIGVLKDAITVEVRQASDASRDNPGGVYKHEETTSYPFQVIAITPGEYKSPVDNRSIAYALKEEFQKANGVWPTEGELKEFRKIKMSKS